MTEPWWRPKTGDLIATVDDDQVFEVLQSGEAEEIHRTTNDPNTVWCWSVNVVGRGGEWDGRELCLALLPGEYVRVP
jgi:hypothetical protein